MTVHIPAAYEGRILRSYLKLTLGLSTAVLAKLKNHERGILVNGQRVTVRYILHEGDVLELHDRDTPETATETVLPQEHPLDVLYEDDYVIALSKPAHMPTHPSHGHLTDTLANALAYRYAMAEEPFVFRPLGRLDRNTSGVVVAGKTRAASGYLYRALQKGEVTKRYIALVEGEMPSEPVLHVLKAPIMPTEGQGEGQWSIKRTVATDTVKGAVYAETHFRVLAIGGGLSLVLCQPITGRTHQIRVHFSHLGYPILGDELYGHASPLIDRHALHALSLSFPLPFLSTTGAPPHGDIPPSDPQPPLPLNQPSPEGLLHTWAPLPSDMERLIASLFPQSPVLCQAPTKALLDRLSLTEG